MSSKIELEPEIILKIKSGRYVDAVKILRDERGLELKRSKELVDLYCAQNSIEHISSKVDVPVDLPFRERHSFKIIFGFISLLILYFAVNREFFGIPLFLYIVMLGGDIVALNLSCVRMAISAKKWPVAEAVMISAEAVYRRYSEKSKKWFLEIEYEYVVSGTTFESENYNWVGMASSSKEKIECVIAKLKKYPTFPVRYNPNKHADSVIVPVISVIFPIGITCGLGLMSLGIFCLLDYFGVYTLAEISFG